MGDVPNNGGGGSAPSNRLIGTSPEGQPVDNVTAANRYEVSKVSPRLLVHLMTEDLSDVLYEVYIPRTREMPDIVMHEGQPYRVYNTRLNPPQYRDCMVAHTQDQKD